MIDPVLLKLSLQRALLGEVTDSLMAVTAGAKGKTIVLRAYFDGEVSEDDEERMQCVGTEVIADFVDDAEDIKVQVYDAQTNKLTMLEFWAFMKAQKPLSKKPAKQMA